MNSSDAYPSFGSQGLSVCTAAHRVCTSGLLRLQASIQNTWQG